MGQSIQIFLEYVALINKQRIANNTLYLFYGVLVGMMSSFLGIRNVLDNIGILDFGIYSIVGGVTTSLLLVNNILSSGTQRFISYELGKGDVHSVNQQFNASVMLHLLLSVLVTVIALIGMDVFLQRLLSIPPERINSAYVVYLFLVCNIVITILSTPFLAVLMSREDMKRVTALNITRSLLLLMASFILYSVSGDKLVVYSIMVFGITALVFFYEVLLVLKYYPEFAFDTRHLMDFKTMRRQLSFSSWNAFGAFATVAQNQGLAILLNRFFGPSMNASFGIANQISVQLSTFSTTLMKAVKPQMAKAEGEGKRESLLHLSIWGSKLSTIIFSLISIPVFIELEYILNLWLHDVPPLTLEFCRIIIITAWVNQLTIGLMSAIQAVGKIALYQTVVGLTLISTLPLTFIMIVLGFPADVALCSMVVISVIACALRIFFSVNLIGLGYVVYLKELLFSVLLMVIPASILVMLLYQTIDMGWVRLGVVTIVFALAMSVIGWHVALNESERGYFESLINRFRERSQLK